MSQRKSLNDKDGQGLAELAAPSWRRENPRWSKWNIVKGRGQSESLQKIRNDQLEFTVNFGHGLVRYTQRTRNGRDARGFAKILNDNVGKTLFSLGEIELPEA